MLVYQAPSICVRVESMYTSSYFLELILNNIINAQIGFGFFHMETFKNDTKRGSHNLEPLHCIHSPSITAIATHKVKEMILYCDMDVI